MQDNRGNIELDEGQATQKKEWNNNAYWEWMNLPLKRSTGKAYPEGNANVTHMLK